MLEVGQKRSGLRSTCLGAFCNDARHFVWQESVAGLFHTLFPEILRIPLQSDKIPTYLSHTKVCFNWAPRNESALGEWRYSSTHSLTLAIDGGEWSASRNWLTPWSRILLQKLIVTQLVKKFPALYGTRRYITVFTRALHWFLSCVGWIRSTPSHPISLKFTLILSSHLRVGLPTGLFPSGFRPKFVCISRLSHEYCMPRPSHSHRFDYMVCTVHA
jgi:hypothetical protein